MYIEIQLSECTREIVCVKGVLYCTLVKYLGYKMDENTGEKLRIERAKISIVYQNGMMKGLDFDTAELGGIIWKILKNTLDIK